MPASDVPRPLTILVVGPDPDMRLYLKRCLRSTGPASSPPVVVMASGRAEALRSARQQIPDLIISDLLMSGSEGAAFHQALATDAALSGVPVLQISDETPSAPDSLLSHPFNAAQLQAAIDQLLPRRG